jgi:hypothetical protein
VARAGCINRFGLKEETYGEAGSVLSFFYEEAAGVVK